MIGAGERIIGTIPRRSRMKKLLLWIGACVALLTGAVLAQDVTGTWQGTISAGGRELRMVIKITNDSGLKATLQSIDQGPGMLPGTVALQGTTVKLSFPGINGTYEGRLEGDSIAGNWSQGGPSLPLPLKRANADTLWALPAAARVVPMPKDALPVFEVATIKPSQPGAQGRGLTMRGRNVVTFNTPVSFLMSFAYGMHPQQIVGGPSWLESENFDIAGQPDIQGVPNEQQIRRMVEKLLIDRLKLTFHREKRELSVYALVVGKTAPKLTKNDTNPDGLPGLGFRAPGAMFVVNATMANFAGTMQTAVLDRPVVDQTGLAGRYDFTLNWTPDETQFKGMGIRVPPPADTANAPPGLFTAIQEQLGLKFESTKAPVDVLVVDRIEKPTEN
jgi:uncharacterized protein (TIGR03435 family)